MSVASANSNGFSFEKIEKTVGPSLKNIEMDMNRLLAGMGPNATAQELLQAQTAVSKWAMQAQLQSSLVKECGDALKGIIQKSG